MSRCQPDALSPDLMTYYQKVRRTKDEIARDEAWLTHGKLQKSKVYILPQQHADTNIVLVGFPQMVYTLWIS